MHVTLRLPRVLLAVASLASAALPLRAASLIINYELEDGTATIDPFDIPNPEGGADLTITPSLTIDSGSFEAVFESGSGIVGVSGGPASIRSLTYTGTISISVTTVIDTGLFPLPVEATLSGPLTGVQLTDSTGSYSILGGDVIYTDTNPGNFDVTAGPLECTDSFGGIVCALLENGLGLTFPLEIPAVDDAPIPFVGLFNDLDSPGASTSGSSFDFSIPVGDAAEFGAGIAFTWVETGRAVIPEPSWAVLAPFSLLAGLRRRRSS